MSVTFIERDQGFDVAKHTDSPLADLMGSLIASMGMPYRFSPSPSMKWFTAKELLAIQAKLNSLNASLDEEDW